MDEHILVVEDSATQARLLAQVLEDAGYRVELAADGHAALEYLSGKVPSLVISDVTMPVMDGYQLCRNIRTDRRLRDLPVILLTNLSDGDKVILGLEAGADSFISKPFDEARLIQRVRDILGQGVPGCCDDPNHDTEVRLSGSSYRISASRTRILRYLVSTYENALQINERLTRAQDELRDLNAQLEERVRTRTAALSLEVAQRTEAQHALQVTDPPSKKGVFKDAITEWNWEVKPKSVGTYRLHITLIAYLGDKPWTKSYDEFLEVYITPTQKIGVWWSKYWQWVITVLIIPVLPFAYKLVKKLYEKYRTRNYIK